MCFCFCFCLLCGLCWVFVFDFVLNLKTGKVGPPLFVIQLEPQSMDPNAVSGRVDCWTKGQHETDRKWCRFFWERGHRKLNILRKIVISREILPQEIIYFWSLWDVSVCSLQGFCLKNTRKLVQQQKATQHVAGQTCLNRWNGIFHLASLRHEMSPFFSILLSASATVG